jgi:hypothetical protein
MAEVIIKNTRDLTQLAKDLRKASDGKELRKQFTTEVRGALRPVAADVRAAYRAAPSMGHASMSRGSRDRPDLRGLLAKATQVQVRTSGKRAAVRVAVPGKRMPSGMRALPRYWEGEKPRWRHPTFGNRTATGWVQQPARRTFDPTVQPHVPQVVAAVNRAADEVRRQLERPGGSA